MWSGDELVWAPAAVILGVAFLMDRNDIDSRSAILALFDPDSGRFRSRTVIGIPASCGGNVDPGRRGPAGGRDGGLGGAGDRSGDGGAVRAMGAKAGGRSGRRAEEAGPATRNEL